MDPSGAQQAKAGLGQAVQLAELEMPGVHTGWRKALCHGSGSVPAGEDFWALPLSS